MVAGGVGGGFEGFEGVMKRRSGSSCSKGARAKLDARNGGTGGPFNAGVGSKLTFPSSSLLLQDDMDCPLCLEELDLSDLNFKPCPCGYQVRFFSLFTPFASQANLPFSSPDLPVLLSPH